MAWFDRFKKKRPEKIGQKRLGHRGIAIGRAEAPDLSAVNISKWKMLTGDEVEDFVHWNQPLYVHSTCVVYAQYFPEDRKMLIEYKDLPGAYMHGDISEEEAYSFATAQSKGSWTWDVIRIRGTKNGMKKPTTKIW